MMKKLIPILLFYLFSTQLNAQITYTTTYSTDKMNQLTQIMYSKDSVIVVDYKYDAIGNRISATSSGLTVLPTSLIEFTVIKDNLKAKLNFSATNEMDAKLYIIEHSMNGNDFSTFDTIFPLNNSLSLSKYELHHCCPKTGVNFYRIKIINVKNKISFSEIREVVFENNLTNISIYPNPTSGDFLIEFPIELIAKNVAIVIYDINGKRIYEKEILAKDNLKDYSIDATYFQKSQYVVTLISKEEVYVSKLIVN